MARKPRTSIGRALEAMHARVAEAESDTGDATVRAGVAIDALDPSTRRSRELLDAMAGAVDTDTILEVEPERCKMWARHNRLYELLTPDYCADLIEGFKSVGQIRPAIVRRCNNDPRFDYEVISGARRHWTANYLNRRLRIIIRDLSDEEAFLISDAENRESKDISEYERALEYHGALHAYYGGSQRQMAARIGMSESELSRFLSLVELDAQIIAAYPDPREIKIYHARQIRALWKDPDKRERLLEKAEHLRGLAREGRAPTAGKEVFAALIAATRKQQKASKERVYKAKETGKTMLTASPSRGGTVYMKIELRSGATRDEILEAVSAYLQEQLTG